MTNIQRVFILFITRHGTFRDDTYMDSIYSSEEGAWSRIEKKFYKYVEAIKTIGYEVRQIKFHNNGLTFEYEDPLMHVSGSIRYEIQERMVDHGEHLDWC